MSDWEPITRFGVLEQVSLDTIVMAFPSIQAMVLRLRDIDRERGFGVVNDQTRCVWTNDGHRITVGSLGGQGLMGSISKDVDPLADPSARKGDA